jgi:hypothetical protein
VFSPLAISAQLSPHDNFPGRSPIRFGVGELIDLSFSASAGETADSLGGLKWFIAQGLGTLTDMGANNGTALYVAPASGGPVALVLKTVSGVNSGTVVATCNITIVEPNDAQMIQKPGTGILHVNGTWSCAFLGEIFLLPTDVSFTNILMREGSVPAVASGYLASLDGQVHDAGPLCSVGTGDIAAGCKVNIQEDKVVTGILAPPPPFSDGDFLWEIPWEYSVGNSALQVFTTAQHHATADTNGQATISKKGAGPFSRMASAPTTGF